MKISNKKNFSNSNQNFRSKWNRLTVTIATSDYVEFYFVFFFFLGTTGIQQLLKNSCLKTKSVESFRVSCVVRSSDVFSPSETCRINKRLTRNRFPSNGLVFLKNLVTYNIFSLKCISLYRPRKQTNVRQTIIVRQQAVLSPLK